MYFEEKISSFKYEYKTGLLGKKGVYILSLYEKHIDGIAASYSDGKFHPEEFDILYDDIRKIWEEEVGGFRCLAIEFRDASKLIGNTVKTFYLPNIDHMEEARKCLSDQKHKIDLEKEARINQELEQQKEEQKHREECRQYYKDCYAFHIADKQNPYFELQNDDLLFSCIYIDQDKNLNFLKIDANTQEESNGYIPYSKIHYYEKAGSVHYVSDIEGNCSSFGGSISGATVSAGGALLGGLLFGPMGMAAGALLTHKPMQVEAPVSTVNFTSNQKKIDDRSVILNYYSDIRRQYIDIELPAGIYNFLQTYLPERKYGIVIEIEKKNAVNEQNDVMNPALAGQRPTLLAENDDTDAFENKIKKLKIMYDNGILTDEEFLEEKKKILLQL